MFGSSTSEVASAGQRLILAAVTQPAESPAMVDLCTAGRQTRD